MGANGGIGFFDGSGGDLLLRGLRVARTNCGDALRWLTLSPHEQALLLGLDQRNRP